MIKNFFKKRHFRIPSGSFGSNATERIIEVPWALKCIRPEDKRVLDVGYAFADDEYLEKLANQNIDELYGVDAVYDEKKCPLMIKTRADIRESGFFEEGFFDLILAISVIEHIGYDNGIYFDEKDFQKDVHADKRALENLIKVLKPGGRLMLSVPYGKKIDYGWFVQYDEEEFDRLLNVPGIVLKKKELFRYDGESWTYAREKDLRYAEYKGNFAPAASGLVCVLLDKK